MTALTDRSFTEFVTSHRFVLVHFWASPSIPMRQGISSFAGLTTLLTFPFLAIYREGVLFAAFTSLKKEEIVRLVEELVSH